MGKNSSGKASFFINTFKAKGVTNKDTHCLSVGVSFQMS